MRRAAETTARMNLSRSLHLSLLLSLGLACTLEKSPLESSSSGGDASESAEATSAPTTGAATTDGDATTGTSPGDPGTSSEVGTGTATTIDIDTDDTGVDTTTGPDDSELIVFPDGVLMCMPVCVQDKEPRTTTLQPDCQVFEIDVEARTQQALLPCEEVQFEWVVPAGQVRCYAELIDRDNETPSPSDQISETCLEMGVNLEFLIVSSEPAPPEVAFGAICELSDNRASHCPNL